MLARIAVFSLCIFMYSISWGQTGQSLGMPLNTMLTSEYSPSLTGNGRTMILQSTTGEDGMAELVMSHARSGIWSRPEPVPNVNSKTGKIPLAKDYVISYDGESILFSASKYGTIGGTDIWIMEKTGNIWGLPKNVGKPVNSTGGEADPSLSADGKHLYFVRYTGKKTATGLPCGKIYVSEKVGKDTWKEPTELPAPVNTGCECAPRILADNHTLIFSSARAGGKGGYDLYRTQMNDNGTWSAPKALTFVNTENDDQYVSVPGSADFLYYTSASAKGKGTDIFKVLLPEEFKAKKVILVEGVIRDEQTQQPIAGRVVAYDLKKNTIASIIQTDATGVYHMFLPEGTQYDFSVNANDKKYTYYSSFIDLDTLEKYRELRPDSKLSTVKNNEAIVLSNIRFEPYSAKLMEQSTYELFRIQRLMQDNPSIKVEIAAYTNEVKTDTVPSPDLTEVKTDSVEVTDPADSTGINKIKIAKTTFHNNRTQKEAESIADALVKMGIPRSRITAKGYGNSKPLVPESGNIKENLTPNRRVELIIK